MKKRFHTDRNWKESNILKIESLGVDITCNVQKPWATKEIIIDYVLIRHDSF